MKLAEMDKLMAHFDKYFQQTDSMVLHSDEMKDPHIDVLVYKPNEAYPFWKLVTMGASDIQMPKAANSLGNRNEYMMFVEPEVDLTERGIMGWYYNKLMMIALYPHQSDTFVTYGHSMEWGEEPDSDMVGAFLEMPQVIEDVGVLRCKLGLLKQTVCLQVVLLTRPEMKRLLEIGPEKFSDFLYPEEGTGHFLSQRYRSERF